MAVRAKAYTTLALRNGMRISVEPGQMIEVDNLHPLVLDRLNSGDPHVTRLLEFATDPEVVASTEDSSPQELASSEEPAVENPPAEEESPVAEDAPADPEPVDEDPVELAADPVQPDKPKRRSRRAS